VDIFDIARLAGVSRKTVQRVLNDATGVRPETRDKIRRIMEQHDYEPNAAARKLAMKKTNTIGLFIVEDVRLYRLYPDDSYYGAVIGAIISACSKRGYHTLVSIHDMMQVEPIMSLYRQKSIDGGIIISWSNVQALANRLLQAGHIVGAFDLSNVPDTPSACFVPILDNKKGAYSATKALIDGGHRELGIITGNSDNPAAEERLQGFRDAARDNSIPIRDTAIRRGQFTEQSGAAAIHGWVAEGTLPRAIVCSSDAIAYGALQALRELGIRVPEDVSLIGFDDLARSMYCIPPLTTMRVPRVEMAVCLAESLLARIEGMSGSEHADQSGFLSGQHESSPGNECRFEAELIVRGTCKFDT
jgi:LacI family transcriptional regulator